MIEVIPYSPNQRNVWDDFIAKAKNSAFLFERDYQDYHCDRFPDSSFMFRIKGELRAVLPACRIGDEVSSHGALTFGGMITDGRMTTPIMADIFEALLQRLRAEKIRRFVYKPVPRFYHILPSDEDLYAITTQGGKLFRRDVGAILCPQNRPRLQERRVRALKKAKAIGLSFGESQDLATFWKILEEVLASNHGHTPVHSLSEMSLLKSRFEGRIRLFAAFLGDEMLAGTLVYENVNVAHAQYIAAGPEGTRVSALDMIFSELINIVYHHKPWFSFGISTEAGGTLLNRGLAEFKEGFGARACVQDFYEVVN